MSMTLFLRILFVLSASFIIYTFEAAAEDYSIACYYNDTNENRDGKNPDLMWPSKAYAGASQNFYWALDSDSSSSGYTKLSGKIVDGFFVEEKLSYNDVLERCRIAIKRGTTFWPSKDSYKLYDFKASSSNFTGNEYPIQFTQDKSSQYQINKVVVFGDSLSDTGNLKKWTKIFPYYPYWYGRFSDGFIWTDFLSQSTHLPVLNFAFGGAKTDGTSSAHFGSIFNSLSHEAQNMVSGNTKDYINLYLTKYLTTDSYKTNSVTISAPRTTLYVLWIGGNDISERVLFPELIENYFDYPDSREGINTIQKHAVNNIIDQINLLNSKGAYNFLIMNLPDIGRVPVAAQNGYHKFGTDIENVNFTSQELTLMSLRFNSSLNTALKNLQSSLGNKINIHYLEIAKILSDHLENKNPYDSSYFDYAYVPLNTQYLIPGTGDLYIQDFCYKENYYSAAFTLNGQSAYDFAFSNRCKDKDGKAHKFNVFFDKIHPTSYTHCWLAKDIETLLIKNNLIAAQLKDQNYYKAYCQSKIEYKDLMQ